MKTITVIWLVLLVMAVLSAVIIYPYWCVYMVAIIVVFNAVKLAQEVAK